MPAGAPPAPSRNSCGACRARTTTSSSIEGIPMDTRSAVQVTAGYYQASLGLRLFRFALATSQKVWPGLAVRAAVRLFATPLPLKWLQKRTHWDASWRLASWPFEDAELTVYSQ